MLPDVLYGKYTPGPRALFRHLFGSSWHGEDARSLIWLLRHPLVLALLFSVVAAAGACRMWRCVQQGAEERVCRECCRRRRCCSRPQDVLRARDVMLLLLPGVNLL